MLTYYIEKHKDFTKDRFLSVLLFFIEEGNKKKNLLRISTLRRFVSFLVIFSSLQ